jgi:hypothetical protein
MDTGGVRKVPFKVEAKLLLHPAPYTDEHVVWPAALEDGEQVRILDLTTAGVKRRDIAVVLGNEVPLAVKPTEVAGHRLARGHDPVGRVRRSHARVSEQLTEVTQAGGPGGQAVAAKQPDEEDETAVREVEIGSEKRLAVVCVPCDLAETRARGRENKASLQPPRDRLIDRKRG